MYPIRAQYKCLAEKLKLELSEEKTLVTIATDKARFLGYDIRARKPSNLQRKTKRGCYARNYNGHIVLEVPTELVQKKLLQLGAMEIRKVNGKEIWKPTHRGELTNRKDIYILNQYNGEVRGIPGLPPLVRPGQRRQSLGKGSIPAGRLRSYSAASPPISSFSSR